MRNFIADLKKPCYLFLALSALLCKPAIGGEHAKFTVDIYRTQQISVQQVLDKYKNDLQLLSDLLLNINHHSKLNESQYSQLVNKIISGLNKEGSFACLHLSPIMYPSNNTLHITIDAVDIKDKRRLFYFTPKPTANIPDPANLIGQWQKYQAKMAQIIFSTHQFPQIKPCTAWYCMSDLGDPTLKKQIAIFKQQVPKFQTQLSRILNLDKNPNKRAAAALLLGYAPDGHALVPVLTASMRDPDAGVRNNVNLILSHVLSRVKVKNFPAADTVQMLDFPSTTDRNKTLAVIFSLVNQPAYAQYYAKHAGKLLIASLKMQQPNLHNNAFLILKKISGKPYGERDYQKWAQWANAQQAKT